MSCGYWYDPWANHRRGIRDNTTRGSRRTDEQPISHAGHLLHRRTGRRMVHTRRLTADRIMVRMEHGQKGGAIMKPLLDWPDWCRETARINGCSLQQLDRAMQPLILSRKIKLRNEVDTGQRQPGNLPTQVRYTLRTIKKKDKKR